MTRLALSSLRKLTQRLQSSPSRAGRKKQLQRAIRLESLENRHLMAGVVAGTVFNDLNANGVDDPGENGIAGWTVFIDSNGSGTLNPGELSTVTDSKGKYSIPNVPAGLRDVYEIPQPGWRPTPGFSDHVNVSVLDNKETRVKFGNVNAPIESGNITGEVFEDDNQNLVRDSGEHGLAGWTIFLDANGDSLLSAGEATAITNIDGVYLFTNIPAGNRTVVEIPQGAFKPTSGGLFPTVASPSKVVTVTNGATASASFPNAIPQVGTIQGNIYQDANGDGIKAASDAPMAGISVYVDVNSNLTLDAGEPVRTTDAAGAYSFVGIRAGSYRVTEVVPAGNVAAFAAPSSQVLSVFSGSVNTLNFFNVVPTVGSVTGKVFEDLDANGIQGAAEVVLAGRQVYIDQNNNGVADAGEPQTTTGTAGTYSFTGVPYGLVTVRNVLPANWLATNPSSAFTQFVLLNGENRANVDFGTRENIGLVRGTVWNDDNGDGIHQATEGVVAGATVYLDLDSDGSQSPGEPAAVTGADGVYMLTRVTPGTYKVNEIVPAAMVTAVSKATSVTMNVLVGGIHTVDFFNLLPRVGSISGTIFSDANSNRVQDATEAGLPGFQVYADVNKNGAFDAVDILAISDAAGHYTLVDVPYGAVDVHEVLLPSYSSVNFPDGVASLVLLNGEARTGLNFATKEPVDFTISGMAFFDANHDGVRQADERGLSGVKVYLDTNNNSTLDAGELWTMTSIDQFYTPAVNELGTYAFTHLPKGDYTVREIVPVDQEVTPATARVLNVTLGPASKLDANFANIFRPNEIHGVVFEDTDSDGVYDPSENKRSGVEIYIDSNRDDVYQVGEPLTVTAADGSYSFTGLTPGAYIVRELHHQSDNTYPRNGGGILWPAGTSNAPIGNVSPTLIQQSLTEGQSYRQTVSLTLPNGGGISNLVDVFLLFDDTGSFTANSPIVRAAFPEIISRLQASLPGVDLGFGVGRFEEYGNFAAEFATGRPFILNQPIVASSTTGFASSIQSALDRMAPGYGGDGPETDIEALFQVVTGRGFDGNNNGSMLDSGVAGPAATQLFPGNSGDVPSFDSFTPDPANNVLPAAGNVGGAGFRPGALPIILTATDIGFAYQPKNETSIVGSGGLTLPLSALTSVSRPSTPFGSGAGIQETVTGLNALGALVVGLGTNPEATVAPRSSLEALAKLTGAINQSTTTIANGTADPIAPGDPLYFQISSGFGTTVADGVTNAIQNALTTVAMDITLRASDPRVHIINHTGTVLGVNGGQTASFDVEFIGDSRPHRFDLQFVRAGTNVVIGSIPVVLGTPVQGDNYGYDEMEDGEIHQSSHFGHYVANVAPSFVGGSDVSIQEDAGTQSVAAWATSISAGPASEAGQVVNFLVTNSNPALFSSQPSISPNGTLTFTPAANANGTATVTVQLHDNGGAAAGGADTSAPQTFVISVASVNDAPTVANDAYTLTTGQTLAVPVSGVLANDVDVDGDALTAQLVDAPLHGTVTLQGDGSFDYVPAVGYSGTDSFTYTATDGTLTSTLATVSLTIDRTNVAPVATGGAYTTNEDTALTVAAPGVLDGDTDADADPLTAVLVSGAAHGTVVLNADGSFVYTPSLNYSGPDSFTYAANDGRVNSNVATIDLTVVATNHAPVAVGDTFAASEDTPLTVAAPGVLAGDTDADSDPLTASVVSGPAHGVLLLNASGSFTYTPAANFNGVDTFSYKVNDGQVDSNTAVVTINIAAVNDAPVAVVDTFAATEDSTLNVAAPGVLANDTDVEGSTLVPTIIRNALHGAVTLSANGSFQYVPAANYNGLDSFTYSVSDGALSSAAVTVTLNVANVNDAPVAVGNSYNGIEDVVLSVAAPGVLAGDTDIDGNVLRALLVTAPTKGSLLLNINGSFVYTPQANANGVDTFTYKANDGTVDSNTVTVTLNIAAVNDVPVAAADSYNVNQNAVLNTAAPGVLGNDIDGDGDVLSVTLVAAPTHGSLTLNANGSFSYTPTTGYNGPDSFSYQASDAVSTSAVTTVSIAVLPPPTPTTKFFVVDPDRTTTFQYAADGTPVTNNALNRSNSKARGIASDSTGSTLWVIDGGGTVFVYDKNGTLLGSWLPQGVGKPEGITVWGNDLWLVDPTGDRVYFFSGGASVRTGKVNATSNFALNSGNLNSTDLVTDGVKIWVVNDTTTADKVFRYTKAGVLEGSWTISTTNTNPTGITLDPANVNHLWIVDAVSDRVYQYDGATARLTGAQEPSVTFALAALNTNPQGIADPLMTSASSSSASSAAPLVVSSSSAVIERTEARPTQTQLVDSSLQQLIDDSQSTAVTSAATPAALACHAWVDELVSKEEEHDSTDLVDQLMAQW